MLRHGKGYQLASEGIDTSGFIELVDLADYAMSLADYESVTPGTQELAFGNPIFARNLVLYNSSFYKFPGLKSMQGPHCNVTARLANFAVRP